MNTSLKDNKTLFNNRLLPEKNKGRGLKMWSQENLEKEHKVARLVQFHLRFKQAQPKMCHSPKVEDGVEN